MQYFEDNIIQDILLVGNHQCAWPSRSGNDGYSPSASSIFAPRNTFLVGNKNSSDPFPPQYREAGTTMTVSPFK